MAKSKTTSNNVVTKALDDDKDKAIGLALDQIERQFGKGSIMRLGESTGMDVDVIPTGAISLDVVKAEVVYYRVPFCIAWWAGAVQPAAIVFALSGLD